MKLTIEVPQMVGEPKELAKLYGRALISQDFQNPRTGNIDTYSVWHAKVCPALALPVTPDGHVLVVDQFRHQAAVGTTDQFRHRLTPFSPEDAIVREMPGGNPKGDQTPEDVIRAEVEEETGHRPGEIIRLAPKPLWIDPASLTFPYWPMLALDCVYVDNPKPDQTEFFEVRRWPIATWLQMIEDGEVNDSRAITITHLALKHLRARGYRL